MPEILTLTLVDHLDRPILAAIALGDPQETLDQLLGTAKQFGLATPARAAASEEMACRGCGCTESSACMTAEGPCCWVEEDLCSACAQKTVLLP